MSVSQNAPPAAKSFSIVRGSFLQSEGLPFAEVLPEEKINQIFEEEGVRFGQPLNDADRDEEGNSKRVIFTPAVTLWACLSQAVSSLFDRGCAAAVARVCVMLVAMGRKPCSLNTGTFCKARAKIPERVVRRLATEVAREAESRVPREWLWHGRHVKLADGFTVSLPDTPSNQAEYPQAKTQKKGLGFPIIRCVVLISMITGMIRDMEASRYSGKETGEMALLRKMLGGVELGEVIVADRYYCAFFSIAILLARGADMVTRLHHKRSPEDGRRERLGDGDWLVDWHLPVQPSWMDDETYARMPRKMPLRVIDVRVARKGYRTRSFHVVTTLLNHVEYPADDIRALYAKRWLVELDIRSIKSTMNFDVLRRETPEGARTELWTGVLAYNLIRQTMLQAAFIAGRNPREMSFAHALQSVKASWGTMILLSPEVAQRMSWVLIAGIATVLVGQRPHRTEPRAVKRRPKPHALLKKTREEARAELLKGLV